MSKANCSCGHEMPYLLCACSFELTEGRVGESLFHVTTHDTIQKYYCVLARLSSGKGKWGKTSLMSQHMMQCNSTMPTSHCMNKETHLNLLASLRNWLGRALVITASAYVHTTRGLTGGPLRSRPWPHVMSDGQPCHQACQLGQTQSMPSNTAPKYCLPSRLVVLPREPLHRRSRPGRVGSWRVWFG